MNWSWVATADLVAERRDNARELVGSRLSAVSYVLLDYGRPDRPDGSKGPRLIAEATELASPAWRCGTFDWADHAVEFMTAARRVFTCSWDAPGCHEGIWLREAPARGPLTRWTPTSPYGMSATQVAGTASSVRTSPTCRFTTLHGLGAATGAPGSPSPSAIAWCTCCSATLTLKSDWCLHRTTSPCCSRQLCCPTGRPTIDVQIRAIGTGHPSRRCVSCPTVAELGELVSNEIRISSDTLDE